jgi:hypothetical protein
VTTDTVPPHDMGTLRQSRSGTSLVLRWAPATDSVGLRGYRVTAPGGVKLLVKSPTVRLPFAKLRGKKITVVAVDLAGNAGNGATIVARG